MKCFLLWGVGDSGSCRPRNARCATTGTPNTGLFKVPPGRTRPPEGGPGVPPRATPPQNPGRRRAGLAEGKRPSARTSVPATPRPGAPSSNPEGLSGVVRRARTYCGWQHTGQESLPPSRLTRVTNALPTRLFLQDPQRNPGGTGASFFVPFCSYLVIFVFVFLFFLCLFLFFCFPFFLLSSFLSRAAPGVPSDEGVDRSANPRLFWYNFQNV